MTPNWPVCLWNILLDSRFLCEYLFRVSGVRNKRSWLFQFQLFEMTWGYEVRKRTSFDSMMTIGIAVYAIVASPVTSQADISAPVLQWKESHTCPWVSQMQTNPPIRSTHLPKKQGLERQSFTSFSQFFPRRPWGWVKIRGVYTVEIRYNGPEGTGEFWLLNPNVVKSNFYFFYIFL